MRDVSNLYCGASQAIAFHALCPGGVPTTRSLTSRVSCPSSVFRPAQRCPSSYIPPSLQADAAMKARTMVAAGLAVALRIVGDRLIRHHMLVAAAGARNTNGQRHQCATCVVKRVVNCPPGSHALIPMRPHQFQAAPFRVDARQWRSQCCHVDTLQMSRLGIGLTNLDWFDIIYDNMQLVTCK